jgi:GNAT superfamily N-acetyltransferase
VTLASPQPLGDHHELESFSCGVPSLDEWLKRRSRANQAGGASRSYVLSQGNEVIGYYALASGAIALADTIGRFRRNMPDPIPIAILGRLAVDQRFHGQGFGRALFRDAGLRLLQAAEILGIRGLIVHAISEEARAFYLALGLLPSPSDPMMLMVSLAELRASLGN